MKRIADVREANELCQEGVKFRVLCLPLLWGVGTMACMYEFFTILS